MKSDGITVRHLLFLMSCCIFAGTAVGITANCIGQFVTPLSEVLHKPVGTITIFITLISLSSAFFGPIITKLMKKVHVRLIMSIGIIVNAACLCLLAFVNSIELLYGIAIVLGIANVCFNLIPITILLNNWFYKNIGTFSGIVASFSGVVGALFNPIVVNMINRMGYQYAFIVCAVIILVTALPCAMLFIRFHPQEVGVFPYGFNDFQKDAPEMKDTSQKLPVYLLVIVILFAICQNCIAGLNPSIASMANSIPLASGLSATMVSSAMIGNVLSKLSLGVLVDKFGAKIGVSTMLILAGIGLFLLSTLNPESYFIALGACLIYGCIFSCSANGAALVMREIYGPVQFGELYPTVALFASIAYAGSVAIVGKSYDLLGSYSYIEIGLAFLCLATIGLLFIIQITEKIAKK